MKKTLILLIALILCSTNIKCNISDDIYQDIYDCHAARFCYPEYVSFMTPYIDTLGVNIFDYFSLLDYNKESDTVYVCGRGDYLNADFVVWNRNDTLAFKDWEQIELKNSVYNNLMLKFISKWDRSIFLDYAGELLPSGVNALTRIIFDEGVHNIYCYSLLSYFMSDDFICSKDIEKGNLYNDILKHADYNKDGYAKINNMLVNCEWIDSAIFKKNNIEDKLFLKFIYKHKMYSLPIKEDVYKTVIDKRNLKYIKLDIAIQRKIISNDSVLCYVHIEDVELVNDSPFEYDNKFPLAEMWFEFNNYPYNSFTFTYLEEGLILRGFNENKEINLYYPTDMVTLGEVKNLIEKIKLSSYGKNTDKDINEEDKVKIRLSVGKQFDFFNCICSLEELPIDIVSLFFLVTKDISTSNLDPLVMEIISFFIQANSTMPAIDY